MNTTEAPKIGEIVNSYIVVAIRDGKAGLIELDPNGKRLRRPRTPRNRHVGRCRRLARMVQSNRRVAQRSPLSLPPIAQFHSKHRFKPYNQEPHLKQFGSGSSDRKQSSHRRRPTLAGGVAGAEWPDAAFGVSACFLGASCADTGHAMSNFILMNELNERPIASA